MKTKYSLILSISAAFINLISISASSWTLGNVLMTGISAGVEFTESMAVGQSLAHRHCQHQFKWHRWNCPAKHFLLRNHRPGQSTREGAVIDAITAAAMSFSLTRNCTRGQVAGCTCQQSSGRGGLDWQWGGCSDNIEFGERMSQQFLDMVPLDLPPRDSVVRLHNNQAGRHLVRTSMRRVCKCHGVSGSCATKTCWKQIGDFPTVAQKLRRKYEKAKKLGTKLSRRNAVPHGVTLDFNKVAITDLVYLSSSPDFCLPDPKLGISGSRGRECSRARSGAVLRPERRSCRALCRACGLSVTRRHVTVSSSCRCKFLWCCQVVCDTCNTTVQKHICQ